jgi:hypothetical protein
MADRVPYVAVCTQAADSSAGRPWPAAPGTGRWSRSTAASASSASLTPLAPAIPAATMAATCRALAE